MAIIRLDKDGNAPVPEGYIPISTEVEFLKVATENLSLQIRGDRLCNWAQMFYSGRGIQFQEIRSYSTEFRSLLPNLTSTEISGLVALFGNKLERFERPFRIESLLNALYPNSIWHVSPSLKHLAEWLLWLAETELPQTVFPILDAMTSRWKMEELPFDKNLYSIHSKEDAREALKLWLGLLNKENYLIEYEFPLEVPEYLLEEARNIWNGEIIRSNGKKIQELVRQKIPFSLKRIAAEESFQYFMRNWGDLNVDYLELLSYYLKGRQIAALRNKLQPNIPTTLPIDPTGVVAWFQKEYLPYREWQRFSNSSENQETIIQAARQFELWYLDNYPRAIFGGNLQNWLSFNKINQITCPDTCITLLIILDGMHVPDSRILLQNILSQTQRLSVTSQEYVFAPIPTVTLFAKESLLKGVPPSRAAELEPVGKILPEKQSPAQRLQKAEKGKIYIWRVLEPDNTYHHKNTSENLLQDVEGRLEAEALKIKEIVESIPDDVILQIILTTDHGRLLSETKKSLQVPMNMESHGRAAWGKSNIPFDSGTYTVQNDVAYLQGEPFGMQYDMAIPLDEGAFKDNNNHSGTELFPHGGIFPEEVILPWIVLARDMVQPDATIEIAGNGKARREGIFQIEVLNKSDIELFLETVTIVFRTENTILLKPGCKIPARLSTPLKILFEPWPSAGDVEKVTASARMRLPNQMVYEYDVEIALVSEDFYTRKGDNVFEDMD